MIAVVAMDDFRGIGVTELGTIPWDIPEDLAHFRELTLGKTVVMGRTTYETLEKPLDGRTNVILTRNPEYSPTNVGSKDDVVVLHDIKDVIDLGGDIVIIGGAEIYEQFLPHIETIHATHVMGNYVCDKKFPEFIGEFNLVSDTPNEVSGGRHVYRFAEYKRV